MTATIEARSSVTAPNRAASGWATDAPARYPGEVGGAEIDDIGRREPAGVDQRGDEDDKMLPSARSPAESMPAL